MFRSRRVLEAAKTIYSFTVRGADHKPYDLKQHMGHPLLIMNVASECGFTNSGYTMASELYNKFKGDGFTVLAFPCNQFGGQEPGPEGQVKQLVCTRYKADFPIMEKVEVKGPKAHPLFLFLQESVPGILGTTSIKWNFTSFLVNGEGVPVTRYAPGASASSVAKDLLPLLEKSKSKK